VQAQGLGSTFEVTFHESGVEYASEHAERLLPGLFAYLFFFGLG
jgi:hypothetical protein